MIVGKPSSSISKTEIFIKYPESRVVAKVFPEVKEIPCVISSPLRKDTHPSFSLFMGDNNHIYYKDFGSSDEKGSLLDLLCKYWKCSFNQCLNKICEVMADEEGKDIKVSSTQIKTLTRKEVKEKSKIEVKVRPWRDYDYEYWESYGIEPQWLRYAEIYPISHKIVTRRNPDTGKTETFIFNADEYAYTYVERKGGSLSIKIYQPFNTHGYKWCSKMDASVIGLWTKIPEYGDRVVICSSIKDALCLSCQSHIPTLCLQGEGYSMSNTAVAELKRRYKKVYVCFDTDEAGIKDGKLLAEKTGFINIVPDLGTEKDLSDYYKSLKNKEDFKKLETLFN